MRANIVCYLWANLQIHILFTAISIYVATYMAFSVHSYVTGFAKTDRIVTTAEIQFNV